MESKEYSWAWVTDSRLLSHGPCELVYAFITPSKAEAEAYIYDGENSSGDKIFRFVTASQNTRAFSPKVPVYCRRGLYIAITKGTEGIFVQWRELPHKGAEPPTAPPPG
jgi:hypothetical protein